MNCKLYLLTICFSSIIFLGACQEQVTQNQPNPVNNQSPNSGKTVTTPTPSPQEEIFPITGWDVWQDNTDPPQNITIEPDAANETITVNTTLSEQPDNKKSAGYVIERDESFDWGGKTLVLTIRGTRNPNSTFDNQKLFKLEVNGTVVRAKNTSQQALRDPDFVKAVDDEIEFDLPPNVTKVQFVFYNANLNNLTISGKLR